METASHAPPQIPRDKQNTYTLTCGCRKTGSKNQETFARLRQRIKAAPPASSAAAAHVPGSGTTAPPVMAPMLLIGLEP